MASSLASTNDRSRCGGRTRLSNGIGVLFGKAGDHNSCSLHAMALHQLIELPCIRRRQSNAAVRSRMAKPLHRVRAMRCNPAVEEHGIRHWRHIVFARMPHLSLPGRCEFTGWRFVSSPTRRNRPVMQSLPITFDCHSLSRQVNVGMQSWRKNLWLGFWC